LNEAASISQNTPAAIGSLPQEIGCWGTLIHNYVQNNEAREKCKKSAEVIFQFENYFFGPKKVCNLCCIVTGAQGIGGWKFWSHRIERTECDKIRKEEYDEFVAINWIGPAEVTPTISFIPFKNPES
jgi:hypothetical protein